MGKIKDIMTFNVNLVLDNNVSKDGLSPFSLSSFRVNHSDSFFCLLPILPILKTFSHDLSSRDVSPYEVFDDFYQCFNVSMFPLYRVISYVKTRRQSPYTWSL